MMDDLKPGRRQGGVSLIEALVALAVMAFGMLGMVGMQATLRSNSDVSKQRAEAVRIGQGALERWRAFERLDAGAGIDFAEIDSGVAPPVAGDNATFTVTATVTPPAAAVPASAPQFKTVAVKVGWTDRTDEPHAVNLVSTIAGIAPELAGTLSLPNDRAATQRPRGRNRAIPFSAADQGNGTSLFTPPNSGGITWTFNNTTGVITSVCVPANPCVAADHFLLSGFVRFATGDAPTPAEAEQPVDPLIAVGMVVDLTAPTSSTEACFTQHVGNAVAYFCALPTTAPPAVWSGQSLVTGLPIAASMADATAGLYKVCRYTPQATHTPTGGNTSHPLVYADVDGPLVQQNFLVISAGDGTNPYACPADGPIPFMNSTTFPHQPSS